jgi:iron complex transport system substrate-binding protein
MTVSDLWRSGWPAVSLLAAAVVAGGCGGRRPAASVPPASGFPVTLIDAQGARVVAARQPRRIVSLAPTVTEILFALGLGDRVVAVTDQCNYPAEATKLPRVGGWFTPSIEKTLAGKPDLVIGSRGNPQQFLAALRRSGVPVFTVDPKTLDDIYRTIADIGHITGADAAATEVIGGMKGRLASVASHLRDVPARDRATAFIFLQTSPIWTAGSGTFQDDAIRLAGARNIAVGKHGFAPFGVESLLAADPRFLLLSTMAGDPGRMEREVLANPVYRHLSAVKERRLVLLEADEIMRPGPRLVNAVEAMARAFYPARFASPPRPSSSTTSRR